MNTSQVRANQTQFCAVGTWGGTFHPEFGPHEGALVVLEHWGQNGFANTDLDAQLTQREIEQIVLVGMGAETCIEGTARFGMERGYHITLSIDATAAFSQEGMHAAHQINGPRFAHAMVTTEELLARIPS